MKYELGDCRAVGEESQQKIMKYEKKNIKKNEI